jgi:hypothetical protein
MRLKKGGVNRAPDDHLGCERDDMRQDIQRRIRINSTH